MRNKDYKLFVLDSEEYQRIIRILSLAAAGISDLILAAETAPAEDDVWAPDDDLKMEALNLRDKRAKREKSLTKQSEVAAC
jgi:hypothetical protein